MGDFIYENMGYVLVIALLACLVGAGFGIKADADAEAAFMAACQQDHKTYECTAMWRAGESHVMPMPIVIPVR